MHIIHMLFRKNKRKRQHNRRGVSSIFGVIIGVSILITVIMPAQLYIRQVDSYYERQLKEAEERDIERLKEDLAVIAYPINEDSTLINLNIENRGEVGTSIILLMVNDQDFALNEPLNIGETTVLGPFNLIVEDNTAYHFKAITSRGNIFSSLTGTLFYGEGIWFTPSLGISVNIANDKGKYYIEVSNSTWSANYTTLGQDQGDLIRYFEVKTGGIYDVVCEKMSGGWVNLPGTPMVIEIQWPEGSPIVYVYTSGHGI